MIRHYLAAAFIAATIALFLCDVALCNRDCDRRGGTLAMGVVGYKCVAKLR